MKIAVVTDDEKTISAHFGHAQYYVVLTVKDGAVAERETRPKVNHNHFVGERGHHHSDSHGMDRQSQHRHARMMDAIDDCQVLMARGMGRGVHINLTERGIQPVMTDIQDIQEAVEVYLSGKLIENLNRVH